MTGKVALSGKYQAYPKYKNSEIEWVGDIPEHWVVAELKRYSRVQGGYAFSSDSFVDSGIPVIRIGDIKQDGTISLESCKYIQDEVSTQYKDFEVSSGDLLMAMTGATIGKAGWFKGSQRALLNQRVGSFKCNKSFLNYKFFWYVLNSLGYQEYIRITAFGGAQPNISDTGMVSYQSAIPDLIEQEKIANFLDHETAKIDTLIDKQQQLIQLLKEKRQAVISHAVTKGLNPNAPMRDSGVEWLGEVPEHWDITYIKHLSVVKRGASPRPIDDPRYFDESGDYAWVRIADVSRAGMYLTATTQRLSNLGSSLSVKLETDELFVSIAGTVGKPCITVSRACIHDGFVYFPELKINNKYLYYIFEAGEAYLGLGKMGTQLNLNTETVGGIKIGLPPSSEIENIVFFIEKSNEKYDFLINKADVFIKLMQERRTALISAAVTGKIDVRHHAIKAN